MAHVELRPLEPSDREQFIIDNQEAFRYGAVEEFGIRDEHYEEPGQIISRNTIEACLDGENSVALRIISDGEICGGMILKIDPISKINELDILFIRPDLHSKGLGQEAWSLAERMYPETVAWTTCTPYFEKRNIHFYVNRLGFHIVKFTNDRVPGPIHPGTGEPDRSEMFYFEKRMR